jgi:biotin transporter BioY
LQPLVVVLAGMWLGPVAGAASTILICLQARGPSGLPRRSAPGLARFVGHRRLPVAYPVAAFAARHAHAVRARCSGVGRPRSPGRPRSLGFCLVGAAILTGGLSQALPLAFHPFVPLDAVKALVAALLVPKSTRAPV